MPLPDDETLLALSQSLLDQFDALFGVHPGFRPAHAKGALLRGTFLPTAEARGLSKAPHFANESTPISVRFSNSTGLPQLPDNDPNASPHGLAVRFHLAERVHTDVITHSANGFPTHTGEEFLEFLKAAGASPPGAPSPTPIEQFLGTHPAALRFVQLPKPAPRSLATDVYFGVNAMRFTNAEGASRFGRYRVVPELAVDHLDEETARSRAADYLFDEIKTRLPVRFKLTVQLAEAGDPVDDATQIWPESREQVVLGTLDIKAVADADGEEQRRTIFDPIPRVDGIESSDDPLLQLRAAVYLLSGRRRRAAGPVGAKQ